MKGMSVKKMLGVMTLALPLLAWAGFIVEDGVAPSAMKEEVKKAAPAAVVPSPEVVAPAPKAPEQVVAQPVVAGGVSLSSVSYLGQAPKDIAPLQGFGTDVKMEDAVRRVIPQDFQVLWKEGAVRLNVRDVKVSWADGKSWIEILNGFGQDFGLVFEVDWSGKKVLVGDNGKTGPQKMWVLREGRWIGEELKEWGKSVNWTVDWQFRNEGKLKDFVVPGRATYTGDFKAASSEVIQTLANNGVLIRVRYFDGNRTMRVFGPGVPQQ